MITKRNIILHNNCFCEKYSSVIFRYYAQKLKLYGKKNSDYACDQFIKVKDRIIFPVSITTTLFAEKNMYTFYYPKIERFLGIRCFFRDRFRLLLYQHKLINMCAELINQNHCAVPLLSCARRIN